MKKRPQIIIEDHVISQLLTSAIEAYEFEVKGRSKTKVQLETFGLLWGYFLPERESVPARLVAAISTVETSAIRNGDWVEPNEDSLSMKCKFFREYWPQLELIGTFHSHPYKDLKEVNDIKGWRASPADKAYWPDFHKNICPDMPSLAHMVVTITGLERKGTAWPDRLPGGESTTGYVLTAGKRKIWIKGYCTEIVKSGRLNYEIQDDILLIIPTIEQRFQHESLRT